MRVPPPPARLTQGGSALAELSPDGQWLVCQCERPGYVQGAWFVMRVGREAEARQLRFDARPGDIRVGWRGSLTSGGIARITVRPGTGNPRVGVPHRLSLRAESSTGEEISAGSPRWSSGDTANAPIDSLRGVLFATRTGAVSVQGFLPGWRRTTVNLSVSPNAVSLALDERWDNGFGGRWVRFGSPTPVLDSTDGRFTMWNAGDGSLLSGVVLSDSLSPQAGVAVEAEVSVKITRPQWQQLQVAIAPTLDRPATGEQSMRDGVLNARRSVVGECRIIYPGAAEGRWAADTVAGLSGTEVLHRVALPGARKGQWMRFRVQLFPDGRCGFAIDGVPIAISERPSGIDVPVQIQLSGNSVGTRALVGRTRVWTGVPTDIDWTTFELRRSTRHDGK